MIGASGGALQLAALTMVFPGRRLRTMSAVSPVTANSTGYLQLIYNGPGVFVPAIIVYNGNYLTNALNADMRGIYYQLKDMATDNMIMEGPMASAGISNNFVAGWPNFESGYLIEPNKGLSLSWTTPVGLTPFNLNVDIMGTEFL